MSRKNKQHDKQFKLNTIQYVKEHPDLTQAGCCKNARTSASDSALFLADRLIIYSYLYFITFCSPLLCAVL